MFRAQFCAVLGIGLMLAAASTHARELELSVESRIGGDSNVFRSTIDKKSDGYFELTPTIAVHTRNKKLNYDFRYSPTYSTYFETSGIDGFDHRAQGVLSWRPTPKDTLNFDGSYRDIRLVRVEDVSDPGDPIILLEETDRERYQLGLGRLSYLRSLNTRWSIQTSVSFDDYDYSRSGSVDSQGYAGELRTNYNWLPTTVVGVSASYRHRISESRPPFRPEQTNRIWNVSGFVEHSFSPTLSGLIQVGPSLLDTTLDYPGVTPPGVDTKDESISYFATVRLEKRFIRSRLRGTYSRSDSAGGGSSSASIQDTVRINYMYQFARQWTASWAAVWAHTEEITAINNQRKDESTQYLGFFALVYQITDRVSARAQYSLLHQEADQDSGMGSLGTTHSGYVSLRYTFDPVLF